MSIPKPLLDHDLALFDAHALELAQLFGPDANLWSLDVGQRSALFDEPAQASAFGGPWYFEGVLVQYSGSDVDVVAGESGQSTSVQATVSIPRILLERRGAPTPKVGDVLVLWVTTGSAFEGMREVVDAPKYFDVIKTYSSGTVGMSRTPTWWTAECRSRSEFSPESRLVESRT